jgi:hypothetical protein
VVFSQVPPKGEVTKDTLVRLALMAWLLELLVEDVELVELLDPVLLLLLPHPAWNVKAMIPVTSKATHVRRY